MSLRLVFTDRDSYLLAIMTMKTSEYRSVVRCSLFCVVADNGFSHAYASKNSNDISKYSQ